MPSLDTRLDQCRLRIIGNDIYRKNSRRTKVYIIIKDNPYTTIETIFGEVRGSIELAEVRSDVRSLFADGKVEIEGWKVATPRTFKFVQTSETW